MSCRINKAIQTSIIHIQMPQKPGDKNMNTIIGPAKLEIPDVPTVLFSELPTVIFNNSGKLMYCVDEVWFILEDDEWKIHSELLVRMRRRVMVQMSNGIYVFGDWAGRITSEFLPNESHQWEKGPHIPFEQVSSR